MTIFWVLWFAFVALLASAWTVAYAWNASALGLIPRKRAEKYWRWAIAAFAGGIVLGAYAFVNLLGVHVYRECPKSFAEFWLATALALAGFMLTIHCTRGKKRKGCFYLGLALLAAGFAVIAWLTYPENVLIGVA